MIVVDLKSPNVLAKYQYSQAYLKDVLIFCMVPALYITIYLVAKKTLFYQYSDQSMFLNIKQFFISLSLLQTVLGQDQGEATMDKMQRRKKPFLHLAEDQEKNLEKS